MALSPLAEAPTIGLVKTFRTNAFTSLILGILSCLLASVLITGWPQGLIPNLTIPYIFEGDGLSHAWLIKRTIEGHWYFQNARSGYPFGSSFLDYPSSDFGNFATIKLLGWIFGSWYATLNAYFLLGFAITSSISFSVFRALGISRSSAICGAVIFTFLPYHFLRLAHILYTWYFTVPIFFYYAHKLFFLPQHLNLISLFKRRRTYVHAAGLLMCSCFGVYFALFGCLVLACAAFIAATRQRRGVILTVGALSTLVVALGVGINVLPNIANTMINGPNLSVAVRSPGDSEVYGLKIDQMLLPREGHRFGPFAEITKQYEQVFPLVNENSTATLGLFGAIGFLALIISAFLSFAGVRLSVIVSLLTGTTIFIILIASIGGFSSLFAIFVSPSIRGWNRISVFVAFSSITASVILIERLLYKFPVLFNPFIKTIFLSLIAFAAVMDQTTPACHQCNTERASRFFNQRAFFREIEHTLPASSAVYQLPYISFPEVPNLYGVSSYDELKGFLFTNTTHWSHGGMGGRPGDDFFRELSKKPLADQLIVARQLGFAGLTLNMDGYPDQGKAEESELTTLLGKPLIKSKDGKVLFFRIRDSSATIVSGTPPEKIIALATMSLRRSSLTTSDSGFNAPNDADFSQDYLPTLRRLHGLSGTESWGRWSDARLDDHITIIYKVALPRRLKLTITARAYGPNVGKPVRITVGGATKFIKLGPNPSTQSISFDVAKDSTEVDIYPPYPVSPPGDPRLIGVGIKEIRIAGD